MPAATAPPSQGAYARLGREASSAANRACVRRERVCASRPETWSSKPRGAIHRFCRLRNVEPFERSQREGLTLTKRQLLQPVRECLHGTGQRVGFVRLRAGEIGRLSDSIFGFVFPRTGQPGHDPAANDTAALPITNPVLQDLVEQGPPFLGGFVAIAARKTNHRVLNQVQRLVPISRRKLCDAQRATLHLSQEFLQALSALQAPNLPTRHGSTHLKADRAHAATTPALVPLATCRRPLKLGRSPSMINSHYVPFEGYNARAWIGLTGPGLGVFPKDGIQFT